MNKNHYIITAVAALIVGVAAFFGGVYYQKSQGRAALGNFRGQFAAGQFGGGTGAGGRGARFGGGGVVRGQILSSDSNSITVKLSDGSSKIIYLSGSTAITQTTTAEKSALTNGQTVLVIGSVNSDGSVTAQNIQLNPQIPGGSPSPSPQ